ncbi:MAG: hypothetical protein ACXACY_30505 [Candidatus Hodarchaeales archaeon]|jgi:hypothetical protein
MTTKDKREKTGFADFGCNPGDFQGMFNMMNKCCSGRDVQSGWQDTMEKTMGTCCGPKKENTKKE